MTMIDQRQHKRVPFALFGALSFADGVALPCVTRDVSGGGIALTVPDSRPSGAPVTLFLDQLGTVQGRIVRQLDGGFAVALSETAERQAEFATRLERLYAASPLSLIEAPVDTTYADLSPELDARASLDGRDVAGRMPARLSRDAEGAIEVEFRTSDAA